MLVLQSICILGLYDCRAGLRTKDLHSILIPTFADQISLFVEPACSELDMVARIAVRCHVPSSPLDVFFSCLNFLPLGKINRILHGWGGTLVCPTRGPESRYRDVIATKSCQSNMNTQWVSLNRFIDAWVKVFWSGPEVSEVRSWPGPFFQIV